MDTALVMETAIKQISRTGNALGDWSSLLTLRRMEEGGPNKAIAQLYGRAMHAMSADMYRKDDAYALLWLDYARILCR